MQKRFFCSDRIACGNYGNKSNTSVNHCSNTRLLKCFTLEREISKVDINALFDDQNIISKIKERLPILFQIAEIESSRGGKVGMEVGALREKILIALFISYFGENKVDTNIPISEPESDVKINDECISIKTITKYGKIKAKWTVDASSAENFINNYAPKCGIILVWIFWDTNKGGFFFIPLEVQKEVLKELGRESYLEMPKSETNPRGVEFSKKALDMMLNNPSTRKIEIEWKWSSLSYKIYKRWIDYWTSERLIL